MALQKQSIIVISNTQTPGRRKCLRYPSILKYINIQSLMHIWLCRVQLTLLQVKVNGHSFPLFTQHPKIKPNWKLNLITIKVDEFRINLKYHYTYIVSNIALLHLTYLDNDYSYYSFSLSLSRIFMPFHVEKKKVKLVPYLAAVKK